MLSQTSVEQQNILITILFTVIQFQVQFTQTNYSLHFVNRGHAKPQVFKYLQANWLHALQHCAAKILHTKDIYRLIQFCVRPSRESITKPFNYMLVCHVTNPLPQSTQAIAANA